MLSTLVMLAAMQLPPPSVVTGETRFTSPGGRTYRVIHTSETDSSLDPVPACPTCDALTARVAALEAQLAARTVVEPVRRVRLVEVASPVRTVTYSAPVVYSAPLGAALPSLSAWAPGYTATTVERRGIFGRRMFSASVCGPGGCP